MSYPRHEDARVHHPGNGVPVASRLRRDVNDVEIGRQTELEAVRPTFSTKLLSLWLWKKISAPSFFVTRVK